MALEPHDQKVKPRLEKKSARMIQGRLPGLTLRDLAVLLT